MYIPATKWRSTAMRMCVCVVWCGVHRHSPLATRRPNHARRTDVNTAHIAYIHSSHNKDEEIGNQIDFRSYIYSAPARRSPCRDSKLCGLKGLGGVGDMSCGWMGEKRVALRVGVCVCVWHDAAWRLLCGLTCLSGNPTIREFD